MLYSREPVDGVARRTALHWPIRGGLPRRHTSLQRGCAELLEQSARRVKDGHADGDDDGAFGEGGAALLGNDDVAQRGGDVEDAEGEEDVDEGDEDEVGPKESGQPDHQILWGAVDARGLHPTVELQDVRLECDLTAPREEVHVPLAQRLGDVSQHQIEEDGDERSVRMHLVVIALLEGKELVHPPEADGEARAEQAELGKGALPRLERLHRGQLFVEPRKGKGAKHTKDPHEVIEA